MTDSVVVGVRVRPLNEREKAAGKSAASAWTVHANSISKKRGHDERKSSSFCYDSVFTPDSTNDEVYMTMGAPIVEAALGGFNATIFAYGQTSSGKTHTMLGHAADPGITPLAIRHVLRTASASKTRTYLVRAAYVEIYNDKIRDLMNPLRGDLVVREDKAGRVFVDAEETIVESYDDAMAVLERGQAARHVGETKMNARSSRSHTIFTLQIESKGGEGVDQSFRASSLNLVDLAGSERLKSTGAEGNRQKEGAHINKSLLVLGTIINRLSSANGDPAKYGHLPYRDSKLTRLLRPALGGNAKTAIVCAATPSAAHVEETISTLKFAERAKKVTNSAVRNEVVDYRSKYKEAATELAILREQYSAMEAELNTLRAQAGDGDASMRSNSSSFTEMSTGSGTRLDMTSVQLNSGAEAANTIAISVELEAAKEEVKYLKEHVDEVETENEHLRAQVRKKAAEFRGLRQRALELRSSSRHARHSERAVRRALVLSYKKLEEARNQLDISRKKGAHVKKAEVYLEELSKSLQSWLPDRNAMDQLARSETLTDIGVDGRRESNVSELSTVTDARGVSTARIDPENFENINEGIALNGQRSVSSVSRRPRPLPEDMVADIDDSEAETDHSLPADLIDDDETDSEKENQKLDMETAEMFVRISDDSRDPSSAEKPKKKPKGWKAFKNFYGYGYTQRGVYDRLIGGHKVPSTATNIST